MVAQAKTQVTLRLKLKLDDKLAATEQSPNPLVEGLVGRKARFVTKRQIFFRLQIAKIIVVYN